MSDSPPSAAPARKTTSAAPTGLRTQRPAATPPFTTPYAGFAVIQPASADQGPRRFGLYRWHITDPIRFARDLRVTIQALGWQSENRYLPLRDDIASVAFWYQTLPAAPFPPLPGKDKLAII